MASHLSHWWQTECPLSICQLADEREICTRRTQSALDRKESRETVAQLQIEERAASQAFHEKYDPWLRQNEEKYAQERKDQYWSSMARKKRARLKRLRSFREATKVSLP